MASVHSFPRRPRWYSAMRYVALLPGWVRELYFLYTNTKIHLYIHTHTHTHTHAVTRYEPNVPCVTSQYYNLLVSAVEGGSHELRTNQEYQLITSISCRYAPVLLTVSVTDVCPVAVLQRFRTTTRPETWVSQKSLYWLSAAGYE